ncbi:RNA polymerase sigma factor [Granulicoccus sp. GXG6511]|uniref:RNA polymerase sigma factor n=1 Tax=Granulicoccus sp. GXG6511 TaxID=3381351 RepID=UPI003D7DC699
MGVAELVREFEWLSETGAPRVAAWVDRHPALAGCVNLADVVEAVRTDPDPVLQALLREVGAGCLLAARVVLQTMLPKMIVMSRSDRGAFVMDYVAQLWLRILAYPLDRRPRRIAANLALDTLKAVQAERRPGVVLLEPHRFAELPGMVAPDPPRETRGLLRTALDRGLVDPHTHAVLTSVYAEGCSDKEAAGRYGVSPVTIQRRCQRGVRILSAHAVELADAL